MAELVSPHIWYPSGYPGTAYDLREVMAWAEDTVDSTKVNVRFAGDTVAIVTFDKADFEAAKEASLAAGG